LCQIANLQATAFRKGFQLNLPVFSGLASPAICVFDPCFSFGINYGDLDASNGQVKAAFTSQRRILSSASIASG